MAKKKKKEQQEQGGIIKPDFSALIEKMQQEKQQAPKAKAGKKRPKPEQEQQLETITVTPDDIEPPRKHEGSEQERERQQRLKRARELVREEKREREKEQATATAKAGGVLEPLLIHETEKHKQNADRWDGEVKFRAIERVMAGETIVSVCRDMSIPKRTMEGWLAEYREVREQQSVINDFREIDLIETATNELLQGITKTKVAAASVRDIGVAYGILRDKLKDIRGPRSSTGNLRLRATFRGEGAIEVTAGEQ